VELGPALLGQTGALVELVAPGSPAAAAGVAAGDLITSVDGREVTSASSAKAAIEALHPGASVVLGIDRLGGSLTLSATLGSRTSSSP
jgi:S1-C subfamily serine protease